MASAALLFEYYVTVCTCLLLFLTCLYFSLCKHEEMCKMAAGQKVLTFDNETKLLIKLINTPVVLVSHPLLRLNPLSLLKKNQLIRSSVMLSVRFVPLLMIKADVSCCFSHTATDCSLCMLTSQAAVQTLFPLHRCCIIYYLCFV